MGIETFYDAKHVTGFTGIPYENYMDYVLMFGASSLPVFVMQMCKQKEQEHLLCKKEKEKGLKILPALQSILKYWLDTNQF